ncbi:ABC transporter permease [Bauldia litoralis]|uniref:NitT/TauT family transport system permease protein n=1 Tax=Bauldia litoralis TaxID=665467 RepID=A0A1G6EF47_9HYPH|nr:NitT/TauT family transport system permease protein [Bauldia litoralis]
MSAAADIIGYTPARPGMVTRFFRSSFVAVTVIVLAIIVIWYIAATFLNSPWQYEVFARAGEKPGVIEFVEATWSQERPVLPSPHQVGEELYKTIFETAPTSKRSLIYHGWITLSSTLLGFVMGTALGILLATAIVHVASLDKSLMPWIVASQTIPILAIAPMVIVVLASVGLTGLLPKAIISTYLSFFPVAVGMVKGLRSPDPINLDLMRTFNASRPQTFWKLRWPSSVPYLFVSMRVAVAASLVGAIVGELPTGAVAGLGARLLTGSYYGQTVQIWSALVLASVLAAVLVTLVGIAQRIVMRLMGVRA